MSTRLRWIAALIALVLIGTQWKARNERRDTLRLRERVVQTRAEADRCARDLAVSEAEFRELDRRVTTLRAEIDSLEALDPRGVPAARYEGYLATVDAYNEAVERWERRADALQGAEAACRSTVDRYNELADSIRSEGPISRP